MILRDTYFPESEPPHSCFMLKSRETGKILSEMMQLHILELGKYQWEEKEAEELNPLEVLSAYMSCSGDPEREAYVERLLGTGDEVIAMADKELKKVSEDGRLSAYRMSKEMYQDVYKRQILKQLGKYKRDSILTLCYAGLEAVMEVILPFTTAPVSYTHLDVYKRQVKWAIPNESDSTYIKT